LALKEQKPKNHKNIEQKPKKKEQDQARRKNAEEKRGFKEKECCKSKIQAFILVI